MKWLFGGIERLWITERFLFFSILENIIWRSNDEVLNFFEPVAAEKGCQKYSNLTKISEDKTLEEFYRPKTFTKLLVLNTT